MPQCNGTKKRKCEKLQLKYWKLRKCKRVKMEWIEFFPHIIYKYDDMPTKRIGHCKNCGNEKRHRKKSFYG